MVFYARREVREVPSPEKAVEFLAVPTPGYLFVPATTWEQSVEAKVTVPVRVVGPASRLLPQLRSPRRHQRAVNAFANPSAAVRIPGRRTRSSTG